MSWHGRLEANRVGVDGSDGSRAALQWAFELAQVLGSELLLVSVWTPPPTEIAPPFGSFPWGTNVDLSGAAEQALQEMLQSVVGDQDHVKVKTQVASGNAAKILIDLSQDADFLVVGSRGHGGFAGLLLGSVSQHVAAHASCPVVVVR